MSLILFVALASAPPPDATVVVTAPREPEAMVESVSPSEGRQEEVENLLSGLPTVVDLLRLTPAVSVSTSGPRGSQTQVRIRGAEAGHTLLFVDGIRFNDPAAGNEARFELLTVEAVDRIDVIRGPQSAFWGSEAIGGVVAAYTNGRESDRVDAGAEYGGLDSARGWARASASARGVTLGGTAGWQRSEGIDSFGGGGERDGFENRSASLRALLRPASGVEIGAVGHWIEGKSEFDGFDPATFLRGDTLDATLNRIGAARLWGELDRGPWTFTADATLLASANRNRLGEDALNRTYGRRFTMGARASRRLGDHRLTIGAERHEEDFRARDQAFFGGTDQDRSRSLVALVGEWQGEWLGDKLTTRVAARHDSLSAFADATTLYADLEARPARRWRVIAGYGEGFAQPTFYDLYGFFPGSFTGNPALRPERSRGWHAGLRWEATPRRSLGLSIFSADLRDEIVDVFDPATFRSTTANASGASRRKGIEAEGAWSLGKSVRLNFNYTWLHAEERQVAGGLALREARRPKHSFNIAGEARLGALRGSASLAYVGSRTDTDFDRFPAQRVTLGDYMLASAIVSWRVAPPIEIYLRVENAFDAEYQDAVGYNTPGRTVHAGLRLRFGN
ncbi:MAG TPA: TonB-dependent receptor [Allosphingosinicella sp.]|nr:TonB-dependent receptor [Allosphingosinicella sp.]